MQLDSSEGGLIARLIAWCARRPWLVLALAVALAFGGREAVRRAPLDAIPDLSDVQVIVLTEWPGASPDLVEDQITYPLSTSLLAAPKVKFVRGQSFFGLSFVYVIFEDGTDMYWARSRVVEYLDSAKKRLPAGVTPTLGPDATGVGWVYQYALVDKTGSRDLQQLRTLQDFRVRYALESVPGVAEVASVGGFVKQYQVLVDPNRLRARSVTTGEVVRAVRRSNQEVGGRLLEMAGHEHMIRGRGYIRSTADLEQAVVKLAPGGAPIRVGDVATVAIGPELRRGIAELDGDGEAVGGIVVMRYGENALSVIERVEARMKEVRKSLPPGVELVVTYDRSGLIKESIDTLSRTLLEEMLVVSLIIFLFLLHARSSLIPVLTLPLGVLLAFIPLFFQGLTVNIMSLGGIAVAIGAMVDASVILIENVHKELEHWEDEGRPVARREVIVRAMQQVGPSVFFSLLVVTVAFMPVFTLEATEGRLFKPLAFTKTYAMGFAAILSVTVTPALAAILIRGKIRREDEHPISRVLTWLYAPVVRFVVRYRKTVLVLAGLSMAATVPAFLRLEAEFMPPLNEGAILYMPTSPPGMSITEASAVLQSIDAELMKVPEVTRVFGKMGRARTATDPAPLSMAEVTVLLKPRDQWREGLTWDGLIAELDGKLQIPGMPNVWWMPIQTRTEMLATGVRSPLGIQVYGDDLAAIERAAIAIEKAVAKVPGTRSAFAERSTGGFFLDVEPRRDELARHGLSVADVHDVVRTAIGGMTVSEAIEGRERYPISVRYARELRDDTDALAGTLLATPSGAQIPLSQVASLHTRSGPPMIRSEGGQLVGVVFVDTSRPIADYVADAKAAVARDVKLGAGLRLGWVGQFQYYERAQERLETVLPLTLALVLLLLYVNTRSLIETGIVLLAVPLSLIGAVWLLYLLGYSMSVAVWVGLIALAGLDAETGVVMLLYLKLAHAKRKPKTPKELEEAIVEGAAGRVRPKLMTVMTTMLGLVPVLWSTGAGADVMKRIAAPMIGGLVTSFLLELTVYPAIFAMWKRPRAATAEPSAPKSDTTEG